MKLTMAERRVAVKLYAGRYQRSRKGKKSMLLNEFVEETGYVRRYAAFLLRTHGKRWRLRAGITVQGDATLPRPTRKRVSQYGPEVAETLRWIWERMDYLCGKRLAPFLPELVPILERCGELQVDPEIRAKLMRISPATADRLLVPAKRKFQLRGRANTKPGTLLKHKIPIRTFADWNEKKPGFVEIDLVGHDGGNGSGEFAQTLDVTDVHTTWSEQQAVLNKAHSWVFQALKDIRARLPFPLLGIDSDCGGEFINKPLMDYCHDNKITFTRGRAGKKNDGCYVEQKNYSIVRRAVGYARFDEEVAVATLNELYARLRLFTNFFQPTMKLVSKTRTGSKVRKQYDKPLTPFRRVLACPDVSDAIKKKLNRQHAKLNPFALGRQIQALQVKIDLLARKPGQPRIPFGVESAGSDGPAGKPVVSHRALEKPPASPQPLGQLC